MEIGDEGTDDDVTLEICSDFKKTDCCKTPALKSIISDDWSTGDTEKWGKRYFGSCKDKVYKVKFSIFYLNYFFEMSFMQFFLLSGHGRHLKRMPNFRDRI